MNGETSPPLCFETGKVRQELGLPARERVSVGTPLRHLKTSEVEALGQLVPTILCGEESAVHVFYRGLATLPAEDRPAVLKVVTDETEHETMLSALQGLCPTPDDIKLRRAKSKRFFMSMAVREPDIHFAQVSALDSGVCILMDELLRGHSAVLRNPDLTKIATRIKLDEATHVGVTRRATRTLGLSEKTYRDQAIETKESFCSHLAYTADAFEALSVCPDKLFKRIVREVR